MDLVLKRNEYRSDGIFGELSDENGEVVAYTLEHSFPDGKGGWAPIISQGTYTCMRGEHFLHGMAKPFWTFEICGVEGHAGLLFHWGNFNKDSEGCVLLGTDIAQTPAGIEMVIHSKEDFQKFMDIQIGKITFQLLVIG